MSTTPEDISRHRAAMLEQLASAEKSRRVAIIAFFVGSVIGVVGGGSYLSLVGRAPVAPAVVIGVGLIVAAALIALVMIAGDRKTYDTHRARTRNGDYDDYQLIPTRDRAPRDPDSRIRPIQT